MSTSTELVLGSIQQLTTIRPLNGQVVSIRCENCEALELELAKLQDVLVGYEAENQRLMVENARLLSQHQSDVECWGLTRGVA